MAIDQICLFRSRLGHLAFGVAWSGGSSLILAQDFIRTDKGIRFVNHSMLGDLVEDVDRAKSSGEHVMGRTKPTCQLYMYRIGNRNTFLYSNTKKRNDKQKTHHQVIISDINSNFFQIFFRTKSRSSVPLCHLGSTLGDRPHGGIRLQGWPGEFGQVPRRSLELDGEISCFAIENGHLQ